MLNIALVGVGGISGAHIPAWDSIDGVRLSALCDIRPEQMNKYPDRRHYTDFDELLDNEEIDILDICLPTYLHADYAVKALKKGINVICEKPISLNRDDVKRVYQTAAENHAEFMVAQVLRFWPEYEIVKNIYDSNTYGRLLSGSMSRLGSYPAWSWDGWMMDEKRSGLVPYDLHIHDLDFLIYAFGKPGNVISRKVKKPDQHYINSLYEFDGFCISTEASWYAAPYPFSVAFRFQFENAVAAYENGKMTIYEKDGKIWNPVSDIGMQSGNIGLPKSDAYANEIRYFTECVLNKKPADKIKPEQLETVIDILNTL